MLLLLGFTSIGKGSEGKASPPPKGGRYSLHSIKLVLVSINDFTLV